MPYGRKKGGAMPEENTNVISDEEKAFEEQGLAEVKSDELRSKIAEDMGIDPDTEGELLDNLVKRETVQREMLHKTIKQKISWRDKAGKASKKPKGDKLEGGKKPNEKPDMGAMVAAEVAKTLGERDLKALDLPEAVETEVKELAQMRGISIGEAAKLPYIQSRIEEVKAAQRVLDGTPKRNNKGSYKASTDLSAPLDPEDFDLTSEEGRKAWQDAKNARQELREKK